MTKEQINNIGIIKDSLSKYGISNPYLQSAIIATVTKESGLVPKSEDLNYSVDSIKRVFPHLLSRANELSKKPEALGNAAYGGKLGNAINEGYKYRGRGFNQITFKNNYLNIGKKIGVDLVNNPDKLNDPKIAADALSVFFLEGFKQGNKLGTFKKFGVDKAELANDTITATKIAVQANAGLGTNFKNNIVQEGYGKASKVVDSIFDMIKGAAKTSVDAVKKNP